MTSQCIRRPPPVKTGALLAVALLLSSSAEAARVYTSDMVNVDATGIANGHIFLDVDPDRPVDETDVGLRLVMARLAGKAWRPGLGSVLVQLEAARGQVALLDAIATLEMIPTVRIRGGYFRPTFSFEMQTGLGGVPFVNRSLLVQRGLTPIRRLGVDARWTPFGDKFRMFAGLFHPVDGAALFNDAIIDLRSGATTDVLSGDLVFGAEFDVPDVVLIHAMGIARLTGEVFDPTTLGALAMGTVGLRIPFLGGSIDFEGLVTADEEGLLASGVYLLGTRAFETPWSILDQPVAVVPMVRVEAIRQNETEVRGTGGVALAFAGDAFRVAVNQEIGIRGETPVATTFVDVQAGF